MKYQGTSDICIEIKEDLAVRFSLELEYGRTEYVFTPNTLSYYTSHNDNQMLSAYDSKEQSEILHATNDAIDGYIAEHHHELFMALATDKMLEHEENKQRQERSIY